MRLTSPSLSLKYASTPAVDSAPITHTTLKAMSSRCGQDLRGVTGRQGSGPRRSGLRAQPQLAADDQPLHLARALADLEDLRVAVEAGHRRLVHEAVAAEDLRGLPRRGDRSLRGVQLGHGRVLLERLAGVLPPSRLVDEGAGRRGEDGE